MEGGRTSPRRREPKNRHPAATRLPRIGSNDPAVPAEAASPAPSPRVRQRDDGLSPTERRNLSAGDIITWDVLKVPAGSPESQPPAATGTISGLYEGGVLIDRNRRGWPDFRIPTDAITSHFIVNQSEVEQSEPPRRRSRRGGQTEAGAAKAASARRESALTRQLRSEIETLEAQIGKLTGDLRKATQAKHSAKGFQKSAGERRLEQARDEIKELQAELLDVNREVQHLHEIAASERPLLGQEFHMKTGARGNPLPDNVRDLLVNFRTQLGLAGEKSLEAAQMTLEAIGAKIQDRIKKHDALALSNACLVETALMLEDDQYRRMAEELREGPEREIRAEKWTAAEEKEAARVERAGIAAHKSAVLDKVEGWLHNPRYKPKDLPDPGDIDVGDPATTDEDFELALCALLFMGMDATTHARCESPHLPSGPLALVPTTLSLLGAGTTGPSSLPTSVVTQARRTMASLRS